MAGTAGRGAVVDIDSGVLRHNAVLLQGTALGGYVCLGFGRRGINLCHFAFHGEGTKESDGPIDDPLIGDSRRAANAVELGGPAAVRKMGLPAAVLKIDDRAVRRLAIAELVAKAGYNPQESRDWHGRWTDGGGSDSGGGNRDASVVAVGAIAGAPTADAIGAASASLFGNAGQAVLAGLAELGAGLAAPAAFLGTLFIPTNRAPVTQGTLPDHPDIAYRFDRDTGSLTLEQAGRELYAGHARLDGVFVDNEGRPFGRIVDGSVVLDDDAMPDQSAGAVAGDGALARSDTDDSQPKLCPDPSKDRPGGRSKDEIYEVYIASLVNPIEGQATPEGMGVRMPRGDLTRPARLDNIHDWIYFDDCRRSDGVMIEAKGTGYQDMMEKGLDKYPWKGAEEDMVTQAKNQIDAAQGRPIEWYFAEKKVADYMREKFEKLGYEIKVIYQPLVVK